MVFSQIRTSSQNKERVTELTRKFNLGAENIIARIAIGYSLQSGVKFSPIDVKDSGGKEYSKNVLFGNYCQIYEALICSYYQISNNDKDMPRYFKMHLDHGLELIYQDIEDNPNLAACHSCTLIPDTSCEMSNLFLDRRLVIDKKYGYFDN